MRKTSFHLDQESTIISMLAVGERSSSGRSSMSWTIVRVVMACAAALLVLAMLPGGLPWP